MDNDNPINLSILVDDNLPPRKSQLTRTRLLRSEPLLKEAQMRKISPHNLTLEISDNVLNVNMTDKLSEACPKGLETRQRTLPIFKRSGSPITQQKHRPPASDPRFRKVHRSMPITTLNTKSEMLLDSLKTETTDKMSAPTLISKDLETSDSSEILLFKMTPVKESKEDTETLRNASEKSIDDKCIQTANIDPCNKTSQTDPYKNSSNTSSLVSLCLNKPEKSHLNPECMEVPTDRKDDILLLTGNPKLNEWIKNTTENYDKLRRTISTTKKQGLHPLLRARSRIMAEVATIQEEVFDTKNQTHSADVSNNAPLKNSDAVRDPLAKILNNKKYTNLASNILNSSLWIVACSFATLILLIMLVVISPAIIESYKYLKGLFIYKPEEREISTIGEGVNWCFNLLKSVWSGVASVLTRRRECSISLFTSKEMCLPVE